MADNSLKISYKIYLEAEDISQSRISSTASYVSNLFKNCTNSYLQKAEVDNESDMDDFTLRLYIDEKVEEEACSSPECILYSMIGNGKTSLHIQIGMCCCNRI